MNSDYPSKDASSKSSLSTGSLLKDGRCALSLSIPELISWPDGQSVHALFVATARSSAEQTALVTPSETLSYGELERRSARLASRLIAYGVTPGHVVAIRCHRNVSWVIAMLAVWRAGAVWLPLNPSDTSLRHQYQLQDSQAILVLGEHHETSSFDINLPVLMIDAEDGEDVVLSEAVDATNISGANVPAYIMYTSGSTGHPKGVLVSHRNIVRLVKHAGFATLGPDTRLLQTGAATFDAVTFEIWGPLLNGGCVVLPGDEAPLNSRLLGDAIRQYQITTMWLTSPLFNLHASQDPGIFTGLCELIVGGDVVQAEQVARVLRLCPDLVVMNGYGPTENTTFSTIHRIHQEDIHRGNIPIGQPFSNTTAYVLDEQGEPVPRGGEGELYVGGAGVAMGYLNRPELTERHFLADPFIPGGRMYRTGDRAIMQADGILMFLGRRDRQVKIRGYRIELDEIEEAIRTHPAIRETIVQVRQRAEGGDYLAAYATTHYFIDERELRAHLLTVLPDYMVPHFLVVLEALPLNSHGKIDRTQLPDPLGFMMGGMEYVPAETQSQKRLLDLWQRVLGVEGVGITDSLFDVGVDSLAAARLATAINRAFGASVKTTDILSRPTVEAFAVLLDQENTLAAVVSGAADEPLPRAPLLTPQQYPLYVEQIKSAGSVRYNVPIIVELGTSIDHARLEKAWQAVVKHHHALQLCFPMDSPPKQIRHPHLSELPLPCVSGDPLQEMNILPFDIERGPLWRACLYEEPGRSRLFLDFHHLIVDGASLAVLLADLDCAYRGEPLSSSVRQYEAYATWSESDAGKARRQAHRDYWQTHFTQPSMRADLPTDAPIPASRSYAGEVFRFSIDVDRVRRLRKLSASHHVTLFEMLALIYGQFLADITGQYQVCFGVPASAREDLGFQNTVGMFVNTIALSLRFDREQTFARIVQDMASRIREALHHQDFTLYELTQMLAPPHLPGRHPLFDTMFALQSRELQQISLFGQNQNITPIPPGETMFDLNLQIYEGEETLDAEWEYATELFAHETMSSLVGLFLQRIDLVLDDPDGTADMAVAEPPMTDSDSMQSIEFNF